MALLGASVTRAPHPLAGEVASGCDGGRNCCPSLPDPWGGGGGRGAFGGGGGG